MACHPSPPLPLTFTTPTIHVSSDDGGAGGLTGGGGGSSHTYGPAPFPWNDGRGGGGPGAGGGERGGGGEGGDSKGNGEYRTGHGFDSTK